jgi:sigma-B regulation protein RsbU (phosphoserine phosphatase)
MQHIGRMEVACLVMFLGWLFLALTGNAPVVRAFFLLGFVVTGVWSLIRLFRWVAVQVVWRLRHRLIVTYIFIAVAPVLLLIWLGLIAGYSLLLQIAMNNVTAELQHRSHELAEAADAIAKLDPAARGPVLPRMLDPYFTSRYKNLAARVVQGDHEIRYPQPAELPSAKSANGDGIVLRDGSFYLWAHRNTPDGSVSMIAPLTHAMLDDLAPNLGLVDIAEKIGELPIGQGATGALPPPSGRFDTPFFWYANLRASTWDRPSDATQDFVLALETRFSAVLSNVFSRPADDAQGFIRIGLIAGLIIFLLVELICWIIGVSMTRTITGTVHHLYEGTQRVAEGKFSHRMLVSGKDQLAEVGLSFNRMTAHIEQLVTVAKEKERMQSELEIAREVQNQLYPRLESRSPHLRVAAVCRPARTVSGDYFDYTAVREGQVALAIGDVSGKGISAALLMAALQSSLRTQLQQVSANPSTAHIVSQMNGHLCASSTPDKFATFCLCFYDEASSELLYTNAGHVPPVLVRQGVAHRLDVNGTVVGAFPNMVYGESRLRLESGDVLAWFTDGLTEPESEFGEMFGDDRVVDMLAKNAHQNEQRIVDMVIEAARQWTGSVELQDDITLMIARRV